MSEIRVALSNVMTKRLKLQLRSFRHKVVLCIRFLHDKFDDETQRDPLDRKRQSRMRSS